MFRTLIWKEWREQRWKLAFGCVILTAFAAVGLRTRIVLDNNVIQYTMILGILVLPVLTSMGLVAPERADGSLATLLALPTSPRKILAAKTLVGVLLCVTPLLTAAAVSCLIAGGRELSIAQIAGNYGRSIGVSISLFIWMLACGIDLASEARAGLIGLGLLVLLGLSALGALETIEGGQGYSMIVWSALPFGFLNPPERNMSVIYEPWWWKHNPAPSVLVTLAIQVVIAAGLWMWGAWRFPRSERSRP